MGKGKKSAQKSISVSNAAVATAVKQVLASHVNIKKSKKKKKTNNPISSGMRGMVGTAAGTVNVPTKVEFYSPPRHNKHGQGLGVRITVAALDVKLKASAAPNASMLWGASSTTDPLTAPTTLDPSVTGRWLNPASPLLTGLFSRFMQKGVTFRYRNKGTPTTTSAPACFGFSQDVMHPALNTSPTVLKLESLQAHRNFNCWENWDLHVPFETDLLYSYDTGTSAAESRVQDSGSFALLSDFTNGGSLVSFGTLYIEWDLVLYDFSPVYSSVSYLSSPGEDVTVLVYPRKSKVCNSALALGPDPRLVRLVDRCRSLITESKVPRPASVDEKSDSDYYRVEDLQIKEQAKLPLSRTSDAAAPSSYVEKDQPGSDFRRRDTRL
jgi:hypothetical protein